MPALLALIPAKDWLYGGVIVALLIGFGAYTHHERVVGEAKVVAADAAATAKVVAQTAAQTATLKARATMAEQAYDKEHTSIANQPSLEPVRLCINSHASRIVLSAGAAQVPGNAGTSPAAPGVQPVPAGDTSVPGPDISGMLQAFGSAADKVSAELREYQSR